MGKEVAMGIVSGSIWNSKSIKHQFYMFIEMKSKMKESLEENKNKFKHNKLILYVYSIHFTCLSIICNPIILTCSI